MPDVPAARPMPVPLALAALALPAIAYWLVSRSAQPGIDDETRRRLAPPRITGGGA